MKKTFALILGTFLLATPALAFADSAIPTGPTPLQLLTRVAALEAEEASLPNNQPLACAMLPSATTTPVNQQVILAWGSVGAVEQTKDTGNMRPTSGAMTLLFSSSGTWTYSFTFYDAGGKSVSCNAKIKVQ